MKIKEILWRNRRDFSAMFVCENCGFEEKKTGYDDANYHENVIPKMVCGSCGEKGRLSSDSRTPRYQAHEVV